MRFVALVLAGLLLVACGEEPASAPPSGDVGDDGQSGAVEEPVTLEGTLGGDAELEGGCAWLDTDEGRFEVMYPAGYQVAFDPLRLLGPDGDTIAGEGEALRVEGTVGDDMVSACQVGTIFQATDVTAG